MSKPILVALVLVLALAGCSRGGDDSDEGATTAQPTTPEAVPATTATEEEEPEVEEPDRLYTKAELPQLVLQPADAPEGMRYTKPESGPRTLEDAGIILDRQVAEVRKLGLDGIYDAVFDATNADMRVSTRVWLFGTAANADQWLDKTRNDIVLFELDPFEAPELADGSWAARGNVGGSEVISHGFRAANAVVVVTLSSQSVLPDEAVALDVARKAVDRIRSV